MAENVVTMILQLVKLHKYTWDLVVQYTTLAAVLIRQQETSLPFFDLRAYLVGTAFDIDGEGKAVFQFFDSTFFLFEKSFDKEARAQLDQIKIDFITYDCKLVFLSMLMVALESIRKYGVKKSNRGIKFLGISEKSATTPLYCCTLSEQRDHDLVTMILMNKIGAV